MEISKKDWNLFNNKIGDWQEKYIEKRIEKYKEILNSDEYASSKFWKLDELMNKDKNNPGVIIRGLRKSEIGFIVASLISKKVISISDLNDFTDDFKEYIALLLKH